MPDLSLISTPGSLHLTDHQPLGLILIINNRPQQNSEHMLQDFQRVTVQPQLDAYVMQMRQELREEVRVLRTFLAREIQLAQQEQYRPFS